MNLSVIVITLNEERQLARCLESIPKGAEIIVVDSGSEDKTREIALKYQARFFYRPFDDFSSQKNHAMNMATKDWILSLDADEVMSPECLNEIDKVIKSNDQVVYRLNRHLNFMGKDMKFGKTRDCPIRLFPKGKGKFHGKIHEVFQKEGNLVVKKLPSNAKIVHYSYRDLDDYLEKFNRYTSTIAENHLSKKTPSPNILILSIRPLYEFVARYFFRLGLLDGYPGYVYALLSSFYAFVKYEKLRNLYETKS